MEIILWCEFFMTECESLYSSYKKHNTSCRVMMGEKCVFFSGLWVPKGSWWAAMENRMMDKMGLWCASAGLVLYSYGDPPSAAVDQMALWAYVGGRCSLPTLLTRKFYFYFFASLIFCFTSLRCSQKHNDLCFQNVRPWLFHYCVKIGVSCLCSSYESWCHLSLLFLGMSRG